jgi:DNA-binding CsgD family transcriptional regulator
VDGEQHGASSAQPPGETPRDFREDLSGSGWTTTKQAAKALGVSRRSVQGYVGRGILEAREEGEGVNRRFLISIDSLNALVDRRRREADETASFAEASPQSEDMATPFANTGEGLRHLIERLEASTAEATDPPGDHRAGTVHARGGAGKGLGRAGRRTPAA